jgi:hypothetical protein
MIDEADRLYGLPLEDFVAERDALAKRLRADGRRAEADEVKALRKPPAVVWAVNQLMRTQHKPAKALVAAADRAAKNPGDRAALRAHHDALDELTTAGAGLLSGKGRGLSEDALLRVRSALHAASLDRDAREDFVSGRLSEEPAPAGFAAITAMPAPKKKTKATKAAKAAKAPPPPPKPPAPPRPTKAQLKRVERAETRISKLREQLQDAEQELADARADLPDQG